MANTQGALLGDAQANAEYVANAINYIFTISQHKAVAVIGWPQEPLDSQRAFKYWPSTRNVTTDYIGISPDIQGTINGYTLCPGFSKIPLRSRRLAASQQLQLHGDVALQWLRQRLRPHHEHLQHHR
jgi:hypothetical protein